MATKQTRAGPPVGWGGSSATVPLCFPVQGTVLFPPVTPATGGQAGWRVPPPAPGKCRGVLLRVLLRARGAGHPVFNGGSTRV